MKRLSYAVLLSFALVLFLSAAVHGYPKPSPYPISWQLKFEHARPQRIVVAPPGKAPEAFWYVTYMIANLTREEQNFLPVFHLMTEDGKVIRSDDGIPPSVVEAIRTREKRSYLESPSHIAGTLRVGEDMAKEGVAVWREPNPEMGSFSIFAAGLSGEAVLVKDADGKPVKQKNKDGVEQPIVLWKTLEMQYRMLGDDRFPGKDTLQFIGEQWIMR